MTASEIAASLRAEAQKLLHIADVLDPDSAGTIDDVNREAEAFYAPFGYKADGTPRKRPAPRPEVQAKAQANRARRRHARGIHQAKGEVRLNVLSQTTPTEAELADREVAYTTQEPK